MSLQDQFEHILASLHETVLDDGRWVATSGLIDEACGAKGNTLVVGDGATQDDIEIFFSQFCYRGQRHEELERRYFEAYHALDERIPRIRRLPDSQLVHISSLYTDKEMKTSPVYNEALPLADTRDSLNVRLDGPGGSRIVWVIADPIDGEGWSSERVEMVQRLLPHLRQFVRVRQALVEARALSSSLTALLENTRCGVIQLDGRGRIVAVNDRALDLLCKGDGLTDQGGALHATSAGDDAALQRVLARALSTFARQGASGSMMVTRPLATSRLAVHVSPVGEGSTDLHPVHAVPVVLIVDPADRAHIDPDLVASILGLTPAESDVALQLAQGSTIRDIAAATGRKASTIRWHTKQIFGKLNISRQVQLVQLVQSLTALPKDRR